MSPTKHWSQFACLSQFMLFLTSFGHDLRQAYEWLIKTLGKEPMLPIKQQQALEHIAYEFRSLDVAYRKYLKLNGQSQDANDVIELTSLHSRIAVEFLSKTRKTKAANSCRDDDIVCEDYKYGPIVLDFNPEIKVRIDKEVAHLSYRRCGKSLCEKVWPFEEFVPVILMEGFRFFRFIIDTYRDKISADYLGEVSIALADLKKYEKDA